MMQRRLLKRSAENIYAGIQRTVFFNTKHFAILLITCVPSGQTLAAEQDGEAEYRNMPFRKDRTLHWRRLEVALMFE